jgi:hypothetical protein
MNHISWNNILKFIVCSSFIQHTAYVNPAIQIVFIFAGVLVFKLVHAHMNTHLHTSHSIPWETDLKNAQPLIDPIELKTTEANTKVL